MVHQKSLSEQLQLLYTCSMCGHQRLSSYSLNLKNLLIGCNNTLVHSIIKIEQYLDTRILTVLGESNNRASNMVNVPDLQFLRVILRDRIQLNFKFNEHFKKERRRILCRSSERSLGAKQIYFYEPMSVPGASWLVRTCFRESIHSAPTPVFCSVYEHKQHTVVLEYCFRFCESSSIEITVASETKNSFFVLTGL
jgi:hypothetical protein